MLKQQYECKCLCGTKFYVDSKVRYGNPKCPECGQPARTVTNATLMEYDVWMANAFLIVTISIVGFALAWILGYQFPLAVPAIVAIFTLGGIIAINYVQDVTAASKAKKAEEKLKPSFPQIVGEEIPPAVR